MSMFVLYLGLGLAAGVLFAGVGVGVVTTFKATGVVNFAQVGFGMWGAFTFARLRQDGSLVLPIPGLPTPSLGGQATIVSALAISLAMTALLGAASYLLVFRPLRRASTVSNLVASTGLLVIIQSLIVLQFGTATVPVQPFLPQGTVSVAGADLPVDRLWAAGIAIAITAVLTAWFRWSRLGLALRGASESQLNIALARWSPDRLAVVGWVLGALVSASFTILVASSVNLSPIAFGLLIVPGLAAALVGRLSSVPWACAGGLALGVIQSEIADLSTREWWPEFARVGVAGLVPFLVVVAVLVFMGRSLPFRGEPVGAQQTPVSPARPRLVVVLVASALGIAALVVTSGTYRFGIITSMSLAVLFLSIVVLTGFAGQVSLGQAAVAGVGGFTLAKLGTSVPFPINLLLAAAFATVAGVAIGAPALRIRGAQFAIVSMAGAVALESLVFKNPSFTAQSGEVIPPVSLFGIDLAIRRGDDTARLAFGLTVLVILVLVCAAVACIVAGRTGRRFLAVRNDERAAAAAGVDVARTKLTAAALASFIAGLAGGMIGLTRGQLSADSFTLFVGIAALSSATIGGITRVAGALLAGVLGTLGIFYIVMDQAISFGKWYGLVFGIGLVATVATNPEGIAGAMAGRYRELRRRLRPPEPATIGLGAQTGGLAPADPEPTPEVFVGVGAPALPADCRLEVRDLRIAYGGVVAVEDVSFEVNPGEIVGLVGPNGAGKTSLLDGICGFTAAQGVVRIGDRRIDGRPAHRRQHAGIGRSWQDGGLFRDLTVIDNLAVAAERARLGDLGRDIVSPSGVERRHLMSILDEWGLAPFADRHPSELSVGQCKLIDMARAVAGNPAVLLADEPGAGLDSWESEHLAVRLRALADAGRALVVVEHDLTLVRRVCDRLIVLDFGRVLAIGAPDEVLADPRVASAYLGTTSAVPGAAETAGRP